MQRFFESAGKIGENSGRFRLEHRDPISSLRIQAPLSSTPWEVPCGYEPRDKNRIDVPLSGSKVCTARQRYVFVCHVREPTRVYACALHPGDKQH